MVPKEKEVEKDTKGSSKKTSILKKIIPLFLMVILVCNLFAHYGYGLQYKYNPDGTISDEPPEKIPFPYHKNSYIRTTQPDGTPITISVTEYLRSGYVHYAYQPYYTAILDTLTGYWCHAKIGKNGLPESTGFPLHLFTGEEANVKRNEFPSSEKLLEMEQQKKSKGPQSRAFEAPYLKMPAIGPVTSLVIYVSFVDQTMQSYDDPWDHFNGDTPAKSIRRFFKESSNDMLYLSFHFENYHDS